MVRVLISKGNTMNRTKPCDEAPTTQWWEPKDPSYQCPINQDNILIKGSEYIANQIGTTDPLAGFRTVATTKVEVTIPFTNYNDMHLSSPIYGIVIALVLIGGMFFGFGAASGDEKLHKYDK